jgi:hypothetical protein
VKKLKSGSPLLGAVKISVLLAPLWGEDEVLKRLQGVRGTKN